MTTSADAGIEVGGSNGRVQACETRSAGIDSFMS
jgi:hypothetical protein